MSAVGAGYCEHQRLEDACEVCAYQHAIRRGVLLAEPLPHHTYVPTIADTDMVIPDDGSDLDRGTYIAAGTPIPPDLVEAAAAGQP